MRLEMIQTKQSEIQKFLTASEVAELTTLSLYTIRTLCCQRRIPFIKVGRRVIFDPVEVKEWVEKYKVKEEERKKSNKGE